MASGLAALAPLAGILKGIGGATDIQNQQAEMERRRQLMALAQLQEQRESQQYQQQQGSLGALSKTLSALSQQGQGGAPQPQQPSPMQPTNLLPPQQQTGGADTLMGYRPGSVAGTNVANFNYGNIKDPSGGFRKFSSPQEGVGAISDLIGGYQSKYGLGTPADIINRYAPQSDPGNRGKPLVAEAAAASGLDPTKSYDFSRGSPSNQAMTKAILAQEQGSARAQKIMQLDQSLDQSGMQMIKSGVPGPAVQDTTKLGMQAGREIDPAQWGRATRNEIIQAIDKANPDADPTIKALTFLQLNKIMAPEEKMQAQMWMKDNQQQLQLGIAELRARTAERGQDLAIIRAGQERGTPTPIQTEQGPMVFDPRTKRASPMMGPDGQPITGQVSRLGAPGSASQQQNIKLYEDLEAAKTPEERKAAEQKIEDWNRTQGKGISASRSAVGAMRAALAKEHPDWDESKMQDALLDYRRLSSIETGFGGGILGRNVVSLNTVADHAQRVRGYFEALQNGQIPRANQIANMIAVESGKPEVTDFNTGANIMTGEVVRLLTSTGGTEADRDKMLNLINARMSQGQGKGALNVFDDMINARFDSLRTQYAQGRPDRAERFDKQFLSPEAKKLHESVASRHPSPDTATSVGSIIKRGGKSYRVIGGDPADPDVEEVK